MSEERKVFSILELLYSPFGIAGTFSLIGAVFIVFVAITEFRQSIDEIESRYSSDFSKLEYQTQVRTNEAVERAKHTIQSLRENLDEIDSWNSDLQRRIVSLERSMMDIRNSMSSLKRGLEDLQAQRATTAIGSSNAQFESDIQDLIRELTSLLQKLEIENNKN